MTDSAGTGEDFQRPPDVKLHFLPHAAYISAPKLHLFLMILEDLFD